MKLLSSTPTHHQSRDAISVTIVVAVFLATQLEAVSKVTEKPKPHAIK